MTQSSILLIEDEKLMRVTLEDALTAEGYSVTSCESGQGARSALRERSFDVVITDVRLPDIDGIEILREAVKESDAQVIVMTAFSTVKDAVGAMKEGAFDYITKPFPLDEFLVLVRKAMEVKGLKDENVRLRQDLQGCYSLPRMIGESEAMHLVLGMIAKVARSNATVLLTGGSGTGKELVGTIIHYQSPRRDAPLIKVNCAALPDGLIESELFGHEKGAFTGAVRRKPGRFELAHTGTIFLDEIADLPQATQAKILRVIQERTFERLGGTATLALDVRLIAATNRDLAEEVRRGRFREDLYYRLNVVPIHLPPLRDRRSDIPYLIDFFLAKHAGAGRRKPCFSKDALSVLFEYDYPGNVRELENIVQRCVTLASGDVITSEDLPPLGKQGSGPTAPGNLSDVVARAEREHIVTILKVTGGNRTRAAELLGISRKNLWEKMQALNIRE